MTESESFISLKGVSVDYQLTPAFARLLGSDKKSVSVLNNLTLNLPQGVQVTLFGHEGSGKSTLLRLLAGGLSADNGSVLVNGLDPSLVPHIASGYVSSEESEPGKDSVHQILSAYARTHEIDDSSDRLLKITDALNLGSIINSTAANLSTSQRMRLNIARAALSDSPLILFDDVAEILSPTITKDIIESLFKDRTVIIATRFAHTADHLGLPLLLLDHGSLTHQGTINEIASNTACPRIVDVWVEGLRYDLLRELRKQPGVSEARLLPTSEFAGQRLRITLQSSRYLPSVYDLVSQAPLVRVEELPPSLNDILAQL